ncbi:MAG TPA: hypothetical protein VM553_00005, partial [Dongiaceae bacterium]|nr:hypothetical protein [Dongiaceae bacterium]
MRHNTILKAYALAMCLLTVSILALTCSGPLWEGVTDLVMGRVADNEIYRVYQSELAPLCHDCADANKTIKAPETIQEYRDNTSQTDKLTLTALAEPEPLNPSLEAPLLARLGVALLAAFVGFNHWRLYRYLSQPIA